MNQLIMCPIVNQVSVTEPCADPVLQQTLLDGVKKCLGRNAVIADDKNIS